MTLRLSVVNDSIINSVLLKVSTFDGSGTSSNLLGKSLDLKGGLVKFSIVDANGITVSFVNCDDLVL